jgi:hypothetical protein
MNIIELNFLQAVKLFKATDIEKAISLHELHHKQTLAGLEYFKSEKNQEIMQTVTRKNLSPAENKALTNLTEAVKCAPTEQKRNTLLRAREIIQRGTYASKGFPKAINDFFVSNLHTLQIDKEMFISQFFINVLDRYDISVNVEEIQQVNNIHRGIINPKIVLTQSFS